MTRRCSKQADDVSYTDEQRRSFFEAPTTDNAHGNVVGAWEMIVWLSSNAGVGNGDDSVDVVTCQRALESQKAICVLEGASDGDPDS